MTRSFPTDRLSAETTMKALGISEVELEDLIEQGSIRAVQDSTTRVETYDIQLVLEERALPVAERRRKKLQRLLCSREDVERLQEEMAEAGEGETRKKADSPKRRKKPSEREMRIAEHKSRARKKAPMLWKKKTHKQLSLAEMADCDEIQTLFDGEVYAPHTVEGWIREFNPNPRPGRRSKTKP